LNVIDRVAPVLPGINQGPLGLAKGTVVGAGDVGKNTGKLAKGDAGGDRQGTTIEENLNIDTDKPGSRPGMVDSFVNTGAAAVRGAGHTAKCPVGGWKCTKAATRSGSAVAAKRRAARRMHTRG
jgi:hypothetical protein